MGRFTLTQAYAGKAESSDWGVPIRAGAGGSTTRPANAHGESFVVEPDVKGIEGPQVETGKVQVFQRQAHDMQFFRETSTVISGDERAKL